ncbi:MAG: radical SAM protein [Candidatus Hodarchaeales archaeon]
MYKFLHLPVQSGNNQVLQHMRRGYTVEDYECIVQAFRKAIPEITLSTDVITGYPTESASDFEDTLTTIKNTRPSITNISRYWERSDTPAAGLKQLPFKERKIRSTALGKLCKQIQSEDNKKWVGWKGEILLIERGPKGGIEGRNIAYKPIIVNTTEEKLGTWQKVKIIEAKSTHFTGELIL